MESKINKMIEKLNSVLLKNIVNTNCSKFNKEIVDDYEIFLKSGIIMNYINCDDDLNLLDVDNIIRLTFFKDNFFYEKNYEERSNIVFYELFYLLLDKCFSLKRVEVQKFINCFDNIQNVYEVLEVFRTFTAQYMAKILNQQIHKIKNKRINVFSSEIFFSNRYFLTDFDLYPEYEQLCIHFLKTLKSIGLIENTDELVLMWFKVLLDKKMWNIILNSYEKDNELLSLFVVDMVKIKNVKKQNVTGIILSDKEKYNLTNELIDLDQKLKAKEVTRIFKKHK